MTRDEWASLGRGWLEDAVRKGWLAGWDAAITGVSPATETPDLAIAYAERTARSLSVAPPDRPERPGVN
jgi:truncated hemoglobin YjbI